MILIWVLVAILFIVTSLFMFFLGYLTATHSWAMWAEKIADKLGAKNAK